MVAKRAAAKKNFAADEYQPAQGQLARHKRVYFGGADGVAAVAVFGAAQIVVDGAHELVCSASEGVGHFVGIGGHGNGLATGGRASMRQRLSLAPDLPASSSVRNTQCA